MSNQEILQKAIERAIDNGWEHGWANVGNLLNSGARLYLESEHHSLYNLIYNHDFAKALWGEEPHTIDDKLLKVEFGPKWKHHLQQMVIAEDPIKYLGDNL